MEAQAITCAETSSTCLRSGCEMLTSQRRMNHKARGKLGSWVQRLVSLQMLNSQPDGEMALPPLVPLLWPPLLKPSTGKPQQVPKPFLGLQIGPMSNLLPLSCTGDIELSSWCQRSSFRVVLSMLRLTGLSALRRACQSTIEYGTESVAVRLSSFYSLYAAFGASNCLMLRLQFDSWLGKTVAHVAELLMIKLQYFLAMHRQRCCIGSSQCMAQRLSTVKNSGFRNV